MRLEGGLPPLGHELRAKPAHLARQRVVEREADELRGRALAAEASAKQAVETQTVMMQQLQDAVDSWEAAKKELSQCRGELEASQMEVAGYKQHLEHVTQNAGKNAANKPGGMARLFGRK